MQTNSPRGRDGEEDKGAERSKFFLMEGLHRVEVFLEMNNRIRKDGVEIKDNKYSSSTYMCITNNPEVCWSVLHNKDPCTVHRSKKAIAYWKDLWEDHM